MLINHSPVPQAEFTLSRLDYAFAEFLSQRSTLSLTQKIDFKGIIARLSFEQSQGHSCLYLKKEQQQLVMQSGLALQVAPSQCTQPKPLTPLILQQDCLYTQRYWFYETRLAVQLKQLITHCQPIYPAESVLDTYFPVVDNNEIDWQRQAAKTALNNALTLITGGPGTGKTTTVVRILALLQQLSPQPLHIALTAPTGKAAMRLQESIGASKQGLPCAERVKRQIPEIVTTLHRLLGAKLFSPTFRHDTQQPLPYDVVVVDEASMVDLALMSKLVDALKIGTRLILLGDKDQLASVESGSVLADLTTALVQQTVQLQKSHRFQGQIKELATAINQQHARQAWELLIQGGDIGLLVTPLIETIAQKQVPYLRLIAEQAAFKDIYTAFNEFQVLCSNRLGTNSVRFINDAVEKKLADSGKISLSGQWYSGRPVMMTQNNAPLQLYNGDIGICMADTAQQNRLMVFFLRPDGSIKKVLPSRLPNCETVFAMTIHKSQGSEFAQVLMVLPDKMNPVLTKELIYTAITRAKQTVTVVAEANIFMHAVGQKINRRAGLAYKLMA
jgi:exodeoxyribonuclease V alpha subunit